VRRLVYFVAVTLDGFIAGPHRGDPTGTPYFTVPPDLVEFLVDRFPETLPASARAALGIHAPSKSFDTVLEGRGSYEIGLATGVTNAYPHLRHIVFSTSLKSSPDPAVEIVAADPITSARTLKAENGQDIWLVGGGRLAHALLPEIDRLILKQHPAVIGAGVPMFDGRFVTHRFRPRDEHVLDSGIRILSFDRTA
jgi:dihydrofolate reductase